MFITKICRIHVLPFLLIISFIQGCKSEINSDLYVQDIFSDENLTLPMQLSFEVPSCNSESRTEYELDVLTLFDSKSNAKIVGCEEGLTSYLHISFTGEIASQESSYDVTIFRFIDPEDESGLALLSLTLGNNFISRVKGLMSENFLSLNYDDLIISTNLNNDAAAPVNFYASGWADGKAVQGFEGSINRREKVNIRFTNLISAIAIDGGQPTLFYIWPPE